MKTFCTVILLLSLFLGGPAWAGIKVFTDQNFKIDIPDNFGYKESSLDGDLHLFSGTRTKNGVQQTVVVRSIEHTGSGNIVDPSIISALESGVTSSAKITSSGIKTINGQQFLVANVVLNNAESKAAYYIICADHRTILIVFSKSPSNDLDLSSDPDAEALIQSFQFLHNPDIPPYPAHVQHNPWAFYIGITLIMGIVILIGAVKYLL